MSAVRCGVTALILFALFTSCAPVKFNKAEKIIATVGCFGAACTSSSITCEPKINSNLTTYAYSNTDTVLPTIISNCSPSNVDYTWTVKKPDSTVITTTIPGLAGKDPSQLDFKILGQGTYYVFLTASKAGSGLNPFNSVTPLEFIVPGTGVSNSLTCDPKLNSNSTNISLSSSDSNAVISANCTPVAATYLWSVTKNGSAFSVAGLSGSTSTPDIKSYGAGVYQISLYATATGSAHWQSSTPLTITVQDPPPPVINLVECNPTINGSLNELTITAASSNPLISANCLPVNSQYSWAVTKNGNNVSVSGLSGATSNPNFAALGVGTYLIYLTASASNHTSWHTTTPLTITVENSGGGNLTLNCSPRLNSTSTAITITVNGINPLVTSGCNPSTANTTWTVTKSGSPVTIAGLGGASSTANFTAAGTGTYFISLTATAAGYNAYVSPSPLEVTVAAEPNPVREVIFEKLVQTTQNKVDILMIVDDSNSMAADNAKLAQGLQNFVNDLTVSGLDWQMCATVTRSQDVYNNGTYYWGASRNWVNYLGSPQWILKSGAADPYSIFTNTMSAIGAGWAGTDDERGIKAAWWSIEYKAYNNCFRNEASLAVILISDEDERSVGGNSSLEYYVGEYKSLEAQDQPQELVNKVRQSFGAQKKFTFNSIIVKPGDAACLASQDSGGSKSHYGFKYYELSQLTDGAATSICDTNYSNNLNYFKERIINSLASETLECAPVGDVMVTVTPTMSTLATQIENNKIIFNPAIPAGRTVKITYNCPRN